jgi:ubiquinol-cytochrome c reductase cytochrome b subunit
MLLMCLMPLFGRWKLGHRFNVVFVFILLGGITWLTASAYIEDHRVNWTDPAQFAVEPLIRELGNDDKKIEDYFKGNKEKIAEYRAQRAAFDKAAFDKYEKSAKYLKAVDRAKEDADRAKELAGRPTLIPPTGALSMLDEDSKTQGRRLFYQNCSGCHTHFDPDAPDAEVAHKSQLDRSTAPNLYGFAGQRWLERLLDPKQITGPQFFGNSKKLVKSDMVDFVNDTWSDSKTWSADQKKQVIAALVAEADLPGHVAPAAAEQETIKKGQALLKDADRCGQCHNFHAKDTGSFTAPDLTGYGTKAWLTAFIADTAHKRFYDVNNDRMPSFGKGKLTPKQIGFIANWLRGDYDAPAE